MPKKGTTEITPEEIKELRAKLDMTQFEMSAMMNMSCQTISKWEGATRVITVDRWRKNYIYMCAHMYLNGNLSEHGELKQSFIDSVDRSSDNGKV